MIKFAEGYNPADWPSETEMQLRAHCLKRDDMRRSLIAARKTMDEFLDATAVEWERNEAYKEQEFLDKLVPESVEAVQVFDAFHITPPPDVYWGNAQKKERRRQRLQCEKKYKNDGL